MPGFVLSLPMGERSVFVRERTSTLRSSLGASMYAPVSFPATRLIVVAALAIAGGFVLPANAAAQPVGSKPAIFNNANWYLRNSLTSGVATSTFRYGTDGDIPVMGDWNGDGHDTVGVVRTNTLQGGQQTYSWYLRNSNTGGSASITPFVFGVKRFVSPDLLGTIPVTGDWNGDGVDTIGVMVYDTNPDGVIQWQLRNSNNAGPPDIVISYGRGRDRPIVGDWNGDGVDTIGVFRRPSGWLLRNSNSSGVAQVAFAYGSGGRFPELPVVGDWNGDGVDTPAVLRNRPATDSQGGYEDWLFRNSNAPGVADGEIIYGSDAQTIFQPVEFMPRLSWQ
jgi:hypothetical protein